MPVLFVGHGSPMNAISDNEYRRSWQTLGARFGLRLARAAAHFVHLRALADPGLVADRHGATQDDS